VCLPTAKSLASFFVLFMKNDRLPLIAHAHLATADYEAERAKHWKCEYLSTIIFGLPGGMLGPHSDLPSRALLFGLPPTEA
jgi:hypothetical protein